jgi:hypothetical protein
MRSPISIAMAFSGIATFLSGVLATVDIGDDFHPVVALLFVGLVAVHLWLNRQTVVGRLTRLVGFIRIVMAMTLVGVILLSDSIGLHIIAALAFTALVGVHAWQYRQVMARRVALRGWKWVWIGAGVLLLASVAAD